MEDKAISVPTHKDDKSNILRDQIDQSILGQQIPSASKSLDTLPSTDANLKDGSTGADSDAAPKKSKSRKVYAITHPQQHCTLVPDH